MNDLIIFIIIFLPAIILMVSLALLLIGIFKKKRRAAILGIIGFFLFSMQVIIRMRITGEIGSNTKADGMEFQIVQLGTGSLGSHGTYIMEPDGVIVEVDEISEGTSTVRFGWKFEAVDEGECLVIVHQFDGGELAEVNAYRVQTDENLNVSYEQKKVEYPGGVRIRYFDDSWYGYLRTKKVTIDDGNKLWYTENPVQMEEIRAILCRVVGENIECEKPDISGLKELVITYEVEDSVQIREEERKFYITQAGQVYYKMVQWHNYEDPYDQWYLFVPDEWCDTGYTDIY